MLTGGEMLYVGIRRRDRLRIHGGVAIVLPVLQMVHEIKRQTGELRFQLAGDALGFFGEYGAVFCEPLRGLGALLRCFAAQFLLRVLERLRAGLTKLRFLRSALVRKAARFRFVFRACVLLRLARGLDLRIARIHKGQHRLKEQFFQNEHQREKA